MRESNRKDDKQVTQLESQEQIVNKYLESLLSEVGEYHETTTETETETKTETRKETAEVVTIRPDPEVTPEIVSGEVQQQVVEQHVEFSEEESVEQEVREAPDWAQEPFQCLLMRVGDMTIAIPLLALDNIVKWDADLTPIPFQPEWHLGVLQNRDHKIVVVDTAMLLMPEKQQGVSAGREKGSHILIIGDNRFGLACDSLAKPMILSKEDVHWSGVHPDRPWMIGTIREQLSVLLDVNALLQIIRHE